MSKSELEETGAGISDLLRQCGREDRAAWLDARVDVLSDPSATADAVTGVRTELNGVVLGMGGLMDMSLEPLPTSQHSPTSAQVELHRLADRMYELTA